MPKSTIRLGLMPPLTGLVEMYGEEIVHAGQIACDEINENGGVLGKRLELIIEDDGSLPETAVIAANKLIRKHRCVSIIGNLLSNSRIAVAYQVAEPNRIPYLNFSFYEGSILSRYFFHFAALPNQQIDLMIPYMSTRYGSRMFFAGNNYEWPRGSIDAAKHALKKVCGEVVGEEYCAIGVSDAEIEQLLDNVAQSNADVFVPYFAGADQVRLLSRFTERGMKKQMAVVMGHYDEVMASRLSPEIREGFYSSNTYFMTLDTPQNQHYLKRLAALPDVSGIWPKGNGILTNFGEGTYLCVKAFAKAVNQTGSLDSETLVNALTTISVSAPQGVVQMEPSTHHAQVNTYLSRCQADGSFAIVERFGAIKPLLPARYRHLRINSYADQEEDIYLQSRMIGLMTEAVFLVKAANGTIVYTNPGVEHMFGYQQKELLGKHFSMLFSTAHKTGEDIAATISEVLFRKGIWQGETKNITKEGKCFWCTVSVSVFTHPKHGEVWMILNKDITERKQAELQLKQYQNHLEELVMQRTLELEQAKNAAESANRAKSMFLANMSHELRTPLNAVLGFSELMSRDSAATAAQKETLGIINRSGAHLLSMINDVLDISKIEAGRLDLDTNPCDLTKLLHDIGDMMNIRAANKQLRFNLDIASDIAPFVQIDDGKLRQILINLLGNAIKFTARGMITLRAYTKLLSSSNEIMLMIEVGDTGIGIPANRQCELFKPFVQLVQEDADAKGTGLGLAISKSLVELMNGKISVHSVLGKGSTFKVELPVMLANAPDVKSEANWNSMKSLAPNQKTWRLLVVDDNEDNRLLLVAMLANVGFQVHEAKNGQEAIDVFEQWHPHLIWMDMRMPVMDGYEATRKIRQLAGGDEVKIIALTASAFIEQHQKIINAGCDAVLHKPIHIPEIFAALSKQLNVKFIYDDVPPTVVSMTPHLTAERLANVPLKLREQLRDAAIELDTDKIDTAIMQIRTLEPEMADSLEALAKGYQFDQIMQLIEAVTQSSLDETL